MPRPGPRPYECVRRAWHTERHQPLRGSIISQIFRVVTETHSAATRKNREWQEKLPIVVIKAEEILYSKANSEGEYVDPDTLWDRLNDAIDTIIRKEEDVETGGEYLHPCIEAALVLGCVPVKASRSQRLSNPRTYLQHRVQESTPRAFGQSEEPVNERQPQPLHHTLVAPSNQLSVVRLPVGSQPIVAPVIDNRTNQSGVHIPVNNVSCLRPNIECGIMAARATEPNQVVTMGSAYPLYYGTDRQNLNPHAGIHLAQNQNVGNVIIGRPVGWSSAQPAGPAHHCTATRELFPGVGGGSSSDRPMQGNRANSRGSANVLDCDLSLRLGRTSDPPSEERRIQCEYEAGGSGRCQEYGGATPSSSKNPEISFFPRQSSNDHFEPCSDRRPSGSELRDVSTSLSKRKMPFFNDADDVSTSQQPAQRPNQQPAQRPNHFPGQTRWPGL